ncbi:MAG: Rieske 2Fe-2S domain-containing protein [bacterium]
MSNLVKAAKRQDVAPGTGVESECAGKPVAVFNLDGAFFATQAKCPHRGGPLAEGEVEDGIVTCPWHAWRFDVRTGANADNPNLKLACYPVRVEGDDVLVQTDG